MRDVWYGIIGGWAAAIVWLLYACAKYLEEIRDTLNRKDRNSN